MSVGDVTQGRIIRQLEMTGADAAALASHMPAPELLANDFRDYSRAVVRKPWGYEYLIYQNDFCAVWILHIKKGARTSLHCHPHKTSSITVLSGTAQCSTLNGAFVRQAGEVMVAGEGVFHQTASACDDGIFVMEIEIPVNKRDLVRMHDDYGREKMGYETADQMSYSLNNYNYVSLITPDIYYNVRQKLGTGTIELGKCRTTDEFRALLRAPGWNAVNILKGMVVDASGRTLFRVGDVVDSDVGATSEDVVLADELEFLLVRTSDSTVRLSDYIVSCFRRLGAKDVFFVPEASNAHLIDALGREADIRCFPFQTERAAAHAAEGYAKMTGRPGVLCVGTGASCLAALAGVAGAWFDSAPMVVLSAQSRLTTMGVPGDGALRQLASKELDIVDLVRPVTKLASVIREPTTIRVQLEDAFRVCRQGRPGPVWLDVPIDTLGMRVDETSIASRLVQPRDTVPMSRELLDSIMARLRSSRRPVLLAGNGVRTSGAHTEFLEMAKQLGMPVMTSRRGADLIAEESPLFFGRPGTYGQRYANLILQNADLVLGVGSRFALPLIGRNCDAFARAAYKILVDIDPSELTKSTLHVDLPVVADAGDMIRALSQQLPDGLGSGWTEWLDWCRARKEAFPPQRDYGLNDSVGVNPYRVVEYLSEILTETDVVTVDGGAPLDFLMQAFRVKQGQRILSAPGLEEEGFALPAALGVCMAVRSKRVVCLCDRKGLQLSLEELRMMVMEKLPVKILVMHGRGSANISRVQSDYFGGRSVGMHDAGIVGSLQISALGQAYGIRTEIITGKMDFERRLRSALEGPGPVLCDVELPDGLEMLPRIMHTVTPDGRWMSRPLEDMYPFLDRHELKENMLISLLE